MIFNHKVIDAFTKSGKIFFSGAKLCLSVKEFAVFLGGKLKNEEFKKLSNGCSKCWKIISEKFSAQEINELIKKIDSQSVLKIPKRHNIAKECYSKKEAIEFITQSKSIRFTIIQK